MADDSSKLKKQIAFLSNLIKSHKQTAQTSGDKRQVSSMQFNNNNSKKSFSWQRTKQPDTEKQPVVVDTTWSHIQSQGLAKSSCSLDRRKTGSSSSNSVTVATSLDVPAIPGSSGLQPFVTTKHTSSSIFNNKATVNQNSSTLSSSKAAASSRTSTSVPHAVSPIKSANVKLQSLPQSGPGIHTVAAKNPYVLNKKDSLSVSSVKAKNPYVLNKKDSLSVSSVKTVAQKSDLKWSKPSAASSALSIDDSKSYSDSELYTKKSSLLNTTQPSSRFFTKGKSTTLIHHKAPSTSNLQGSFKWSKPMSAVSNSMMEKKSLKKPKLARSKLKWTKPGSSTQAGIKRKANPYVLKKGNFVSGNTTHKQGIAVSKAMNRHKVTKKAVYSTSNQNSLVWRAPSTLKLDRRKVHSAVESTNKKASSRRPSAGFIERRQRALLRDSPVVTRYSVVRSKRKQAPIKAQKLNKVVVIGGVPYKTSSNKLTKTKSSSTGKESDMRKTRSSETQKSGKLTKTVTIEGEKFVMDSKGKTLHRVTKVPRDASMSRPSSSKQSQVLAGRRRSSNGRTIVVHTPTTLVRSKVSNSQSKTLASRVLRRSINNAKLYKKNKKKPASEQYCMFYNRFGKCNKQDTCPYIHDPSKVAVCTKFLRGRCKNIDGSCPFSHKIDRDKMPVCQFFLRGTCSNDNCPYSHVNVSKEAEVCEDFLKGFCSRGQQCSKKHILECEEFSRTGECSKGSKCKLVHRRRKPAVRKRKSSSKEEDTSKISKVDFVNDEGFLPLITASASDSEQTSAQEPLEYTTADETKQMAVEPLVIRPRFLKSKEPEK